MKQVADITSAESVAIAAPVTPMDIVNIKIGSRIALKALAARLILNGVEVSRVPADKAN